MSIEGNMTSDASIAQRVSDALQADQTVARYSISVAGEGTTVTLNGQVGTQHEKATAERCARSVAGVIDVINELTTGGGGVLEAITGPLAAGVIGGGGGGRASGGGTGGAGFMAAPLGDLVAGRGGDGARGQDEHEIRSEAEVDDIATGG